MALLNLRYNGDPILRKRSREIETIDDRILELLEDMVETLYKEEGYGLAAPQVGKLKRVVVIDMRDGQGLRKMINPVIVEKSEETGINIEGCLSVPDQSGYVERPLWVNVEYLDEKGELNKIRAEDYFAVCVCHELDHLDGVLYIDKTLDLTKEEIEALKNKEVLEETME